MNNNSNTDIINNNNTPTTNTENKKESKKGSKKGSKKVYVTTPEKKAEYLETYKSKPCYNLKLKCPLCNTEYIKACEQQHSETNKHILNKQAYEQTFEQIKQENITDEEEQLKLFNENKIKVRHNYNLEKLKIKKPSYYENYKLFV